MPMISPVKTPFETLARQDPIATAQNQAHPAPRILVVDDDPDLRQLLSQSLLRSGYRVEAAGDGEAGWNVLQIGLWEHRRYDLLITDHNMPKLSGVDLVKRLRTERITLPVILATALPPEDTEDLDLAAILQKPFGMNSLVETVKMVLHTSNSSA